MSATNWAVGVTAGKFNPPHLGHLHLLEQAAARVDVLHALVCARPDQTIPAAARAEWLGIDGPANVVVHVTPDDLPADDSVAWARRAMDIVGRRPDVAFTSEPYGATWAAAMGCDHVEVDPSRKRVPVSATGLRDDLAAGFSWLAPAARAALTRRIVLVGAESTGKTTLAEALAARLGTCWVPEWARTYDAGMQTSPLHGYDAGDFVVVARQQAAMEDALARRSTGALVCDTDALMTQVWHRRYLGTTHPVVAAIAADRRPDLYLLCGPDVPWAQDGTRESGSHRAAMHADLLACLAATGAPWVELTGALAARLDSACGAIADVVHFETLT